jgi:Zn-dependent protease with chaperone function
VPVPVPSEKALAYYRSSNVLWVVNRLWTVAVLGLLLFSGLSARLRDLAGRLGRNIWFFTVGIYVVLYLGLIWIVDLPLSYYQGFIRQHAYELSNQSFGKWLGDSLLSLGVEMAVGFALSWVPLLLIARSPKRWWLYTAVLSLPFLFVTMTVKPIWIDPLFNEFKPMKDAELEKSILGLAARAGIDDSRVFEVNKSIDTKTVNAYVTGVLSTKRIVLWDTLIAKLEPDELLVVMAHEMGHYVLGHVTRSIWLSVIVTLAGLFLVDRLGRMLIQRYSHRFGFSQLSNVAAVPLLMLLLELANLCLSPAALAYSRFQEHEADRFALDLTHKNHAGGMAFVKLQQNNLSNPRPGTLYKLFRSTHPSIGDRIDFCNSYHPWMGVSAQPAAR